MLKASPRFIVTSALVLAAGIIAAVYLLLTTDGVEQVKVDGIVVFAGLYVFAQAIERIVEVIFTLLDALLTKATKETKPKTIEERAAESRRDIRLSLITAKAEAVKGEPAAAKKTMEESPDKKLDTAKTEASLLKYSTSFALSLPIAAYLQFSVTQLVGMQDVATWFDVVVTAAAITGGGAAIHDLIGKVQASKEKDKLAAA